MSIQLHVLETEKCIASRLWYTAWILIRSKIKDNSLNNYTQDKNLELEHLIKSTLLLRDQWIAWKLLQDLINDNSERIKQRLDTVDFALMINLMNDNVPSDVQMELLELFDTILHSKHMKQRVRNISYESLLFLERNLQRDPALVCCFIKNLLCIWSPCFGDNDSALQDLYFNVLKKILNSTNLEENPCTFASRLNFSQLCRDNTTLSIANLGTLLSILSNVDLTESKENELLIWLYPALLKTCSCSDIELALYSRKSTEYLKEWYRFLDKTFVRYETADTLDNTLAICNVIFNFDGNSFVSFNSKELLMRIMRNRRHWLIDILDICYTLMLNGYCDKVSEILSISELKNLWPILLFKFLNDCPHIPANSSIGTSGNNANICNSLRFLLDKCNFREWNDPTLDSLNAMLENQLNALEWILKCNKRNFDKEILSDNVVLSATDQTLSIKHILSLLQNYSILHVLNTTVNIHNEDYNAVTVLLKDSTESICVFQAYYAMLNALKVILLCQYYDTMFEEITKYLFDMEVSLQSLLPLTLRIETIENVISMLFLRHEDFSDVDSNSEDDEDEITVVRNDKQLKSENKEIQRYQTGFICNKYAIREILYYLKKSILTTGIECTKLKREVGNFNELDQIQKSICSITKVLADATWRLQLLTSSEFIQQTGTFNSETKQDAFMADESEILLNEKFHFPTRRKNKAVLYKEDESSLDESDMKSEVDVSSEIVSSGNNSSNNGKRRKRLKHAASVMEALTLSNINQASFIVNFMLTSKESLVLQCLWKGNYDKAQEVIEMFNINNSQLDGEVQFSKAIHTFKQEMKSQSDYSEMTNPRKENSQLSTLENIKLAVQENIQTSRLTSQLETFLASQKINVQLLSSEQIDSKEILAMTVLDLALTVGQTHQSSTYLCDAAIKYLKLCRKLENTKYSIYFSRIYQLLYESKLEISVMNLLCDVRIPLSIKVWKDTNAFWTDLTHEFQAYKKSELDTGVDRKIKNCNYLSGQKSFKEIMVLCNSGEKYLHKVHAHLKLLHTLISNTVDGSTTVSESYIIKNSLDSYFGHQIFELNIEPDKLEAVASRLQMNLVYSVLINCCPKFLCNNNDLHFSTIDKWGCVVLNNNLTDLKSLDYDVQDPNKYVINLLSELLQALRDLDPMKSIINNGDIKNLSKYPDIHRILAKTSHLATLDLSELSGGNETLVFFLNVWNLLLLHSIVTIWINEPPYNNLRHTVSLMTISYEIGDLGPVTLATLRYKLLGKLSWELEFFTQTEELNELAWQDLELTQDPRIIFAMANEFYGTPVIRVYKSDSLDDDLNAAVRAYLDHYAPVDSNINSVKNLEGQIVYWLPELVQRYQNYFSQNVNSEDDTLDVNEHENHIILNEYFNLSDKNTILRYKPLCYLYEIKLEYSKGKMTRNNISKWNTKNVDALIWQTRKVRRTLLQYLEGHCWLLSYLVQRIHEESPTILETSCDNLGRTACLENLLNSPWAKTLKCLFNDNQTFVGIQENISLKKLWMYFETALKKNELRSCLEIINALPDHFLMRNVEIQCFKDKVLNHLIFMQKDLTGVEILQYVYQIKDIQILTQTILSNVNNWPINVCEDALIHALHHVNKDKVPSHCKLRMNEALCRIIVFRKILPYCINDNDIKNATWYHVAYCTDKIDPVHIVKSLIDANQFQLCLEWLEYQALSSEIQALITQDLLICLLTSDKEDFKQASKLLQALPLNQSMKMCEGALGKLESISVLQFVAGYLLENCKPTDVVKYQKIGIGIKILEELDYKERKAYFNLLREPLLILEQLLMNGKFESLQRILSRIQEYLLQADIGIENFDKIVRYYAGKSLDFRVALQRDGIENRSKEMCQSYAEVENSEFVMPVNIPTREEWVPNDKARECSCCKAVIFSMFNRRHHCRRCGRVVCALCSQQRMRIPGYPSSVSLRVCNDCKRQTILQLQLAQDTPSTPNSETFDGWRLSLDQIHNQILREEFSFEHAPNVSLCLAILNLHSDHKAYASFLLNRCDEMKQLLQPVSEGNVNPEVDHALIIKMIRSLLIAAKVKCAKLGLNTGLAHCDRFLSQVDLITTLVQSDCLALIPSDDLDEHALRKLRDLLTEKEQWILALDVSTKSGLERQGVWAAWGKACLKVGCLDQARDKFSHCLDKVLCEYFEDWIFLPFPNDFTSRDSEELTSTSRSSKKYEVLKTRPVKDPPLLVEILQILKNSSANEHLTHQTLQTKSSAQEVLNILSNLKSISQGQYVVSQSSWNVKNIYFQESMYYLLMYGSHNSILEFFVKHGELDKCLTYILENDLDPDLFFNGVYLRCLKNECIEKLHESMRIRDTSLLLWKNYLVFTCRSLEKKQFLYTLYQLQIFMKDHVRASMTCIRFYVNDATNYVDLCSRSQFLIDAQKHLETELQIENFSKKRRRSVSSSHSGHSSLTMEMEPSEIDRHVNTISRQMEIAKFLGNGEREGRNACQYLNRLTVMANDSPHIRELPTLFGNQMQKTQLAVLAILCGRDVEEGFGIAFRIMQDYNLRPEKIYSLAGHVLALDRQTGSIEQLIKCCRSSGAPDSHAISDRVLAHCVKVLLDQSHLESSLCPKDQIDTLIRLIADVELKISSYTESRQLKAAYLLAVRYSRVQDVRKILKEADRLGQTAIKSICIKWLQQTKGHETV